MEIAMKTLKLLNYAADHWVAGDGSLAPVHSAVTGSPVTMLRRIASLPPIT